MHWSRSIWIVLAGVGAILTLLLLAPAVRDPLATPMHDVPPLGESVKDSGATDERFPGDLATSPDGNVKALVERGSGHLKLIGKADHQARAAAPIVDVGVLGAPVFSSDGRVLAYVRSQEQDDLESEVVIVSPLRGGRPKVVVRWPGSQSALSFSPDSRRLAFVSGKTGIASVYVVDIGDGEGTAIQVTNVGVKKGSEWRVGEPPSGFVPPPDGSGQGIRWLDGEIFWVASGTEYRVRLPK